MTREIALPFLTRRTALAGGGMLIVAHGLPAQAQGARPSEELLQRLANRAIEESQKTRITRPQVLGFDDAVDTHQLSITRENVTYFFAVIVPRVADGLMFFSRRENPRTYHMHRTDSHLRRVASARNFYDQGGALKVWAGPDCDADFDQQLAVWAGVKG